MFFRKRSATERVDPVVSVLLRNPLRYPGDTLEGVVIVDIPFPTNLVTLEARLLGEERSKLEGLIFTEKNPEMRQTVYYEQYITLRGVDHSFLTKNRSLFHRHSKTVVSSRRVSATGRGSGGMSQIGGRSAIALDVDSVDGTTTAITDGASSSILSIATETVRLIPGIYSFPFFVKLPDSLPPSVELHRSKDGSSILRYRCNVLLVLDGGKEYTTEASFRVLSLPVQLQRWFSLHANDPCLHGDTPRQSSVRDNAGDTASTHTVRSRLMSSPGTRPIEKEDMDNIVAYQHRIRHDLILDSTPHEEEEEKDDGMPGPGMKIKKKNRKASDLAKNSAHDPNPAAKTTEVALLSDAKKTEEEDNGQWRLSGYSERKEGRLIEAASTTTTPRELEGDGNGPSHDSSSAKSAKLSPEADRDGAKHRRKKKHHAHHSSEGHALDESNAAQVPDTPLHEVKLSLTSPAVSKSASPEALQKPANDDGSSHENGAPANKKERRPKEAAESSAGTSIHYESPPWNQTFLMPLRGSLLRSGEVSVTVRLRSPIITVGAGKVGAVLQIDNAKGTGAITRVKYSVITRCFIRTKTEVFGFDTVSVEASSDVSIRKGEEASLPLMELPVPKSAPLTILTEGMGTRTFLNVRLYVGTALKTFSRSIETEILLVSGQDALNRSKRLRGWTCFFRRRKGESVQDLGQFPASINLSISNSNMKVINGVSEAGSVQNRPLSGRDTGDAPGSPSTALTRFTAILGTGAKANKDRKFLNTRQLAATMNFKEAIFLPKDEENFASFSGKKTSFVDPMSGLNPFAAESAVAEENDSFVHGNEFTSQSLSE